MSGIRAGQAFVHAYRQHNVHLFCSIPQSVHPRPPGPHQQIQGQQHVVDASVRLDWRMDAYRNLKDDDRPKNIYDGDKFEEEEEE